jgi:ubiquinone/menaquinone biosynthesis C-methylase UbiE
MFSDPVKNLKQLGLREDMIVADFGAGTGFYSVEAAKLVPKGKVYAIEIQKDFINTIRNKTAELGLENVDCFVCDLEQKKGSKLADKIADIVLVSNILFQVENKDRLVDEACRVLKDNGKILVIDWEDGLLSSNINLITKDKAKKMFEDRGLKFDREIDAGKHHYGFILIK